MTKKNIACIMISSNVLVSFWFCHRVRYGDGDETLLMGVDADELCDFSSLISLASISISFF